MGPCLIICGVFWITIAFITKTSNLLSALIYKVMPFISGAIATAIGLDLSGIIQLLA